MEKDKIDFLVDILRPILLDEYKDVSIFPYEERNRLIEELTRCFKEQYVIRSVGRKNIKNEPIYFLEIV